MLKKVTGDVFNVPRETPLSHGIAEIVCNDKPVPKKESIVGSMWDRYQDSNNDYGIDMHVPPGQYTALIVKIPECKNVFGGADRYGPMMSDTPMELRTNYEFYQNASGHVLIGGLGLGVLLHNLREKLDDGMVSSVTVLELHQDVIDLVSPFYADMLNRFDIRIIQANVFTWKPDRLFNTIYMDIWPDINTDNLGDIRRLHAKYCRHVDRTKDYWLDSWVKKNLQRAKRREYAY